MKWTIHKASLEWGIDRKTLAKRLSDAGFDVNEKGAEFHTQEITRAVVGSLEAERTRLTAADADIREMERQQKRGELIPFETYAEFCRVSHAPNRQRWISLPGAMAQRCNPTDPQFAQDALQQFADESLAMIDSQLAKVKI